MGAFFALGCCFGTGVVTGIYVQTRQRIFEQYHRERELIAPILAGSPAYSRIELHQYSAGGIYLVGDVPTYADFDRLRDRITRAVGETRAHEIMIGVEVKEATR